MIPLSPTTARAALPDRQLALIAATFAVWIFYELPHPAARGTAPSPGA